MLETEADNKQVLDTSHTVATPLSAGFAKFGHAWNISAPVIMPAATSPTDDDGIGGAGFWYSGDNGQHLPTSTAPD